MKIEDIESVVMKLNYEYYELSDERYTPYKLIVSGGRAFSITFLGFQIWENGDIGLHQDMKKVLEIYLRIEAEKHLKRLLEVVGGVSE